MSQADSKNSSGQVQQQTVPHPTPHAQHFEEDTIDLFDLFITLWNSKWLIIATTVVVALGSVVYALQLQKIYKVEALLLPPKVKDIQSINVFGSSHSSNSVFGQFKKNFQSRSLIKKFIKEKDMMRILAPNRTDQTRNEDIYQEFANLIKIVDRNGSTILSMHTQDTEIAAQRINDLIEFIDKETISMLVEDSQNSIANNIRDIEYTIASKRHMAKQRREDTILRYEEASVIATKLGVKDRVDSTNIVQNNQLNITTTNVPLYFRGYKALNAEIAFLKNRESDDPFITGLRDLQEQLARLRSLKIDKKKISAVYIDQAAYPSNNAISPNRRLIVSLSTVVGFFSGIFLAFFIDFVKNQRKKYAK